MGGMVEMNRIVWGNKACSWMRRRRRRDWVIAGAVLGVTILGIVLGLMLSRSDGTSTATAKGQTTVQVVRGDILRTLTVYGEVVPKQEYTFTFDGDRVNEILVSVGQRVEQDQVLVELDSTQQELAMVQAERALQEARAEGIPAVIREKELSYQITLANYGDDTLRAPFAGVVTEINQATTSSENWSLVLIDTSELYIEATVDQLDAPPDLVPHLGLGQAGLDGLLDLLHDFLTPDLDLLVCAGLTKRGDLARGAERRRTFPGTCRRVF